MTPPSPGGPVKVVFVWQDLREVGGVERILMQLRRHLPGWGVEPYVIELAGMHAPRLRTAADDPNILRIAPRSWETLRSYNARILERLRVLTPDAIVISEGVGLDLVLNLPSEAPVVAYCHSNVLDQRHWVLAHPGRFSIIVGVSPRIVQDLRGMLDEADAARVRLVMPGLDPVKDFKQAGPPGGSLRIIYFGRLVQPDKRVRDLVPFVREMGVLGVDYRLTIAGSGDQEGYLQQALAGELEEGRIVMVGALPHDRLMSLVAEQDVAVLFSDSEGFGLSVMEAAIRRLTLVVTRIQGGCLDFFEDGESVYQFPVGEAAEAAKILWELARDPDRRRRGGEAARRVAERFPASRMADGFAAVVRSAVGEFDATRFWDDAKLVPYNPTGLAARMKWLLPHAAVQVLQHARSAATARRAPSWAAARQR